MVVLIRCKLLRVIRVHCSKKYRHLKPQDLKLHTIQWYCQRALDSTDDTFGAISCMQRASALEISSPHMAMREDGAVRFPVSQRLIVTYLWRRNPTSPYKDLMLQPSGASHRQSAVGGWFSVAQPLKFSFSFSDGCGYRISLLSQAIRSMEDGWTQ